MSDTENKALKYVEMKEGGALIFTLQSGSLSAKNPKGDTFNLSEKLGEGILYFDVSSKVQSGKTAISLAAATHKEDKLSFYLTDYFEPEQSGLNAFDKWKSCPIQEETVTAKQVNQIVISEYGMAFPVIPDSANPYYYVFSTDSRVWARYEIPENATKIQQMEFGTVYGDGGLFLLYQVGEAQTLMFQSFIDPKYGKTSNYRFDCSEKNILLIQSVKMPDNSSRLYAMYQKGILLFETPDSDVVHSLTPQDDFLFESFDVHAFANNAISLWALEKEDEQYSKDTESHYNLTYLNDAFPNMQFNLVVKP